MRSDLTQYGVEEARTPEAVDRLLGPQSGTVLMVVNSICGCAAGRARPAIGLALQHSVRPSKVATVFAGAETKPLLSRLRSLLSELSAFVAVDGSVSRRQARVHVASRATSSGAIPTRLRRFLRKSSNVSATRVCPQTVRLGASLFRRLLDFEDAVGCDVPEFLDDSGWPADFHRVGGLARA